jgi:predicted amidophosphoribosyltransferase
MPSKPVRRATRNRHLPRVCRHCHAPMASGDDTCWRCGTQWATEAAPPTTLKLVPDPPPEPDDRLAPGQAATVAAVAVAVAARSRP